MAILADILRVVSISNAAKKMYIVYKANLNYERVKGYLDFGVSTGLIDLVGSSDGARYRITAKGREFLSGYTRLLEALQTPPPYQKTYTMVVAT